MIRIEELLPPDPTEAEAVLHVRTLLRRRVREAVGDERVRSLALLFGRPPEDAPKFTKAAKSERPIAEAAAVVANADGIAHLGYDEEHVERCRLWLLAEKEAEPAYREIIAYDLGTLLALSRAKRLATAGDAAGRSPVPILVLGETGTGKEMLTKAIHSISGRTGKLVPMHVTGMPKDAINDEIFGHVRGAYTDARSDRPGRLEEADGGTLHLDEVGDLPMDAQVRLLRVLQDGVFSRLGENEVRSVNTRIVAATNHDLLSDIEESKTFRRDLYHRICAGEVILPPLRERIAGFELVVEGVLKRLGSPRTLTRSALDAMVLYSWPGNLRELDNCLRVAVASAGDGVVRLENLPTPIQHNYLELPIDVRAAGMLCDDPDGLDLPAELIAGRVAAVEQLVLADAPKPNLPPGMEQMLQALDGLPDPTGTHASLLRDFRVGLELQRLAVHEGQVGDRLQAIAMRDLPQAIGATVAATGQRHQEVARRNTEAAKRALENLDHRQSPWWRLAEDVAALPFLPPGSGMAVMGVVATLIKVGATIDPESVERIRQIVREGGLRALLDRARTAVANLNEDDKDAIDTYNGMEIIEVPEGHHRTWSKQQWESLVRRCVTRKQLEEATQLDGKTIKRHLRRVEIDPPWARTSGRTPESEG